jgi:RNA polymerase sigma-70 factor (TIGR02952 family)
LSIFLFLAEIGEKAAGGIARAFTELYEQYLPKVYRYVSYRISDVHMAEDLTSIIFEKALTKFQSYRSEKASFSTWIFSIARNTLIDHYRVNRREQEVPLDTALFLSSQGDDPEETMVKNEEYRQLQSCISRLATHEKEIIALKFGAEMTNRQIARTLGLSESNVGTILFRTVRKLRDNFNE